MSSSNTQTAVSSVKYIYGIRDYAAVKMTYLPARIPSIFIIATTVGGVDFKSISVGDRRAVELAASTVLSLPNAGFFAFALAVGSCNNINRIIVQTAIYYAFSVDVSKLFDTRTDVIDGKLRIGCCVAVRDG